MREHHTTAYNSRRQVIKEINSRTTPATRLGVSDGKGHQNSSESTATVSASLLVLADVEVEVSTNAERAGGVDTEDPSVKELRKADDNP